MHMGDHYIPRFYLKGFVTSEDSDFLIAFKKDEKRSITVSTANIALENGLYSKEMEQYLANEIEEPANKVIRKIIESQVIGSEDKLTLSKYLMVTWKRVPQHKNWVSERYPELSETIFRSIDEQLQTHGKNHPEKNNLVEKRRKEFREIRETKKGELIQDVWHDNIPPNRTPRSVDALSHMTWKFYIAQYDKYFITSDNPLFFFQSIGIGNQESELSFPITKKIALWASWRTDIREGYYPARSIIVDEINHRTISISANFIFSPRFDNWIRRLCSLSTIELRKII
jgi:hypothetical protein